MGRSKGDANLRFSEALLDFPADHSASRVLGQAEMAEMARLVGEGMRQREAMSTSLTLCRSMTLNLG